jgi:hypothetical protein
MGRPEQDALRETRLSRLSLPGKWLTADHSATRQALQFPLSTCRFRSFSGVFANIQCCPAGTSLALLHRTTRFHRLPAGQSVRRFGLGHPNFSATIDIDQSPAAIFR